MVFLGLGSNIGDKVANLQEALRRLEGAGVPVLRVSSFWETEPWGIAEQDVFVNAVCEVHYEGAPLRLLDTVLEIERQMGRIRHQKWGPRLIDIDILEFHRQTLHSERLSLPHPFYPERDFVLGPLAGLEPFWVPTGRTETVRELLESMSPNDFRVLPG